MSAGVVGRLVRVDCIAVRTDKKIPRCPPAQINICAGPGWGIFLRHPTLPLCGFVGQVGCVTGNM